MRIKSVEIINLKSYKNVTLEFSENINLLIGANNSGKSTIIRSVLNLQYHSFFPNDIRSQHSTAKIKTEISDISQSDNLAFLNHQLPNEFESANGFKILWSLHTLDNNQSKEDYLYFNSKHREEKLPHNRVKVTDLKNSEVTLKQFLRFPDREDKIGFIYPFLAKRKNEYLDQNSNREQTYKIQEGLRNLPAKVQKISNHSHPKSKEFVECCDNILGFRIGVIGVDQSNTNGIEIGIYTTNNHVIPLKSMGDGVANIVGFIVTLLTEDNKLFLIEELENDIHPQALKKLLDLIVSKASKNQFIISTHSHIVLKYLGVVPKSKIFYLEWLPFTTEAGQQINIPTSSVYEIKNDPASRIEILEKLGYEFHDFELYEGYILLEESSAESVIRDFLIPNLFPELYNKLKTISANGVNDLELRVRDFGRLFVFIHTNPMYKNRAWVIADGDTSGKEVIQKLRSTFNRWPSDHFLNFSKNDFEEYYPKKFRKEVNAALKLKGEPKRKAKQELIKKVMTWALKNREEAIQEFNKSAAEVIQVLKQISKSLKKDS